VAHLGGGRLNVGDEVGQTQLELLLGEGLDPVTGATLGGGYRHYRTVEQRTRARIAHLTGTLSQTERQDHSARIVAEEQAKGQRRAVVGFDLTFSVPKSVSALWAVADAGTQGLIAAAHHAAVNEVLDFLERRVAETRIGAKNPTTGSVEQAPVHGVAAMQFDHYDSRAGDPQLHTHVVIANKGRTVVDGAWRSLDGRTMHAAVVALSELYNAVLADRITGSFALQWEHRERGQDRNPAFELAAVAPELVREFSTRTHVIEQAKDQLVEDYRDAFGREPSTRTVLRLWQQATLDTRPTKQVHSLADLTAAWRDRAKQVLGQDASVWARQVIADVRPVAMLRADDVSLDLLDALGERVVAAVEPARGSYPPNHDMEVRHPH
jgi:conjugative relaxase-like TrwC/TraI family protein